ncbi:MAG TPA: PDZ domain-containing protein, partial [Tepidisphaeraceae bacterium]
MLQELKFQLSTAFLTVLTAAALVAAILNFQQLHRFHLGDEGVTWIDQSTNGQPEVKAFRVAPNSSGERAGLRKGDVLVRINGAAIAKAQNVTQIVADKAWRRLTYSILRHGVAVETPVIIEEAPRDKAIYFQYLTGTCFLLIGLFVYIRRGSASKALHFSLYCLASFIFSCFHYTGKLNGFDKIIYWANVVATWLAPTLFLHFTLTFPEPRRWYRARWHAPLLYLPGLALTACYVGFASGALQTSVPLVLVRDWLDRSEMALLTSFYLISAALLA